MYKRQVVDLHGYQSDEIVGIIYNLIYEFHNDGNLELLFITGHGRGAVKYTLLNILEKEKIDYQEINQGGAFLIKPQIYSSYNFADWDDEDEWDEQISQNDLDVIFNEYLKTKE
ncbi:Smr/MutS family protein [Mycoplasmopsis pullorum]|uniref:Smr domain-containing protein n=1 Tax=Mycoplasmopsis pullorum TaxID=48003 RepID=A0A1L4FSJ2_9BACT|nr:Smr/MutS family protein [Mycoplasmopsis pullorum]APJ38587.1 hypothetical protein BLA55_02885 [Mycoplasmopsis pullorum]